MANNPPLESSLNTLTLPIEPRELRGRVLAFAGVEELEVYETALTEAYMPDYYQVYGAGATDVWEGRERLHTVIRPPKFNGRITNVIGHHLDTPFEDLCSFRPAWVRNIEPHTDWYKTTMIGMFVTAELVSRGRGVIGSLGTRIWLYPRYVPSIEKTADDNPKQIDNLRAATTPYLGAFNRVVEKPKQHKKAVVELLKLSTGIGEEQLRFALSHPYSGAFETKRK